MIIINRSNYITRPFSIYFMEAGVALVAIDSFNNIANNELTIVKPKIVKISASLFATGIFIKLFSFRKHKIGKRKILKVLNVSIT